MRCAGGECAERENLLVAQDGFTGQGEFAFSILERKGHARQEENDNADADDEVEPHAEDVQGKAGAVGGVFAKATGGAREQGIELRQIALRWRQRELPEDQEGIRPVSYTHLDVYKRQT